MWRELEDAWQSKGGFRSSKPAAHLWCALPGYTGKLIAHAKEACSCKCLCYARRHFTVCTRVPSSTLHSDQLESGFLSSQQCLARQSMVKLKVIRRGSFLQTGLCFLVLQAFSAFERSLQLGKDVGLWTIQSEAHKGARTHIRTWPLHCNA